MNKKIALFMACCAISCLASCNESETWHYKCTDGDKDCSDKGVMKCNDGNWELDKECAPGTLCSPITYQCENASQVECQTDGDRKCEDNRVLVCDGGKWRIETKCRDDQTCSSEAHACVPKETPAACDQEGARKCEDNKVMACSGGNWNFVEDCGTDKTCNETTFACDPKTEPESCDEADARKCEDNKVMVCDGETWSVEKTCTDEETCNETTFACDPKTADCEDNETRCTENPQKREICVEGSWHSEDCDNSAHCVMTNDGAICAECEGDETLCEVRNGVSMLSKCENYQWGQEQACVDIDPTKMVCDANPGKTCIDVLELLKCPEEGNVACQDVYGTEYAVICENGEVTEASGVCEDGKVCYVPEGGCTTPDECGNDSVGAGEDCEEGKLGDATCATVTGDANATGDLACTTCKYDITGCLYCGDGTVNNSEVCDGSVPEDATCTIVINDGKKYTGTLKCKDDCTYDLTECTEEIPEDCTPENCKTDDPNATAECVQNTCEIKCIDGYTDVDGVCKPKTCTAEDTKCGENVFYQCSEGELKSIPMPDDGNHYICDATTDNGWLQVACLDASHCTEVEHATIVCNVYVCEVSECEGNWSVNADKNACECADTFVIDGEGNCIDKCTAADTKCDGAVFYKCGTDGLVSTINKPTDGKHYICDATTDNGWVEVACEAATDCTDVPAHATMACNANVCEVSECDGNWSVNADKNACECADTFVIDGEGNCIDKCTAADTKCNGDVFYKCGTDGLVSTINKPTDGKHYICDATTDNGWVEVACEAATDCTDVPAHATMACNAYVCEVASCEGNWSVNADKNACECTGDHVLNGEECIDKCTAADTKCDGDNYYQCGTDGLVTATPKPTDGKAYICKDASGWEAVACTEDSHCMTAPLHATMACNAENTCEVASCEGNWSVNSGKTACECTGDYVLDGTECKAKCTAADTKCNGDVFYKCGTDGLVSTINKPTDGKHYICDATTDNGWVEVACDVAADCTAAPHATMACNANVCEVASCEGNWSVNSGKTACECTGDHVLNGEECIDKCTAADTKCNGDVFYKCGTDGLVSTINKPTDGKHYICDATTDNGWVEVACDVAADCTAAPHATMACNANVCEVASCEGNWSVNSGKTACECTGDYVLDGENCVVPTCAVGEKKCDGASILVCNETRTGFTLLDTCTTSVVDATPFCVDGTFACSYTCGSGRVEDGGECVDEACHTGDTICNDAGTGLKVCNSTGSGYVDGDACPTHEHADVTCSNDVEGKCGFECHDGYVKNASGNACDREILACNFQWIGETGAYGNVALNGKTKDDYNGRVICMDQADATHIITLDAVYNKDVDSNVEFGVADISSIDAGKYNCTFEFKLADSSTWFACQGVEYSNPHWADPIAIEGDDFSVLPATGWYREYTKQLCTPESRECAGANQYKVCNADGLGYSEPAECDTAVANGYAVCSGSGECGFACNETDGYFKDGSACVCTTERNSCTDNGDGTITVVTCEASGSYQTQTLSDKSCKSDKEVGECLNNDTKCVDGEGIYTCSAGVWGTTASPCDFGCADDGKSCKDAASCTDANSATIAHGAAGCKTTSATGTCNNGEMELGTDCLTQLDIEHATAATCTGAGLCELTACEDGYYVKEGQCVSSSCTDANDTVVANGATGCKTTSSTGTCNNGTMTPGIDCLESFEDDNATAAICTGAGVCTLTTCKPGYHVDVDHCVPDDCTDANEMAVEHGEIGCFSKSATGACYAGTMQIGTDCLTLKPNATAATCTGEGECTATACEDGYHVEDDACKENQCEPNKYFECDGAEYYLCNADGSNFEAKECTALENATVEAICAADGSAVTCKNTCKDGFAWKDGVEESECVVVATLPCKDVVSGADVENGKYGCASTTAMGTCNNGDITTDAVECSEMLEGNIPENADAVCDPTLTELCTFKCKDGFVLSADGKSCVKNIEVEWCKFQWLSSPQNAGGRIKFPEGLGDSDVLAYMACTDDPTTAVTGWTTVDASWNEDCNETHPDGNACGPNKEYMVDTNTYTGVAGTNYCAFIFDFDNHNIFACPKDGGAGVRVADDTVLTADQYLTFEGDFCIGKSDNTYCNGDVITVCEGGLTKETQAPHCDANNNNVIACEGGAFKTGEAAACAENGKVCSSSVECVEATFGYCNFDWMDNNGAFGIVSHVFAKEDYQARLVCVNKADATDKIIVNGVYDKNVDDGYGGQNYQFKATSADNADAFAQIAAGDYKCTFEFAGRNSSNWYACAVRDASDHTPLAITDESYATLGSDYVQEAFCLVNTNGEYCLGDSHVTCNSRNRTNEDCSLSEQTCSMNGGSGHCAECAEGTMKCGEGEDANKLYACESDVWSTTPTDCELSNQLCNSDMKQCVTQFTANTSNFLTDFNRSGSSYATKWVGKNNYSNVTFTGDNSVNSGWVAWQAGGKSNATTENYFEVTNLHGIGSIVFSAEGWSKCDSTITISVDGTVVETIDNNAAMSGTDISKTIIVNDIDAESFIIKANKTNTLSDNGNGRAKVFGISWTTTEPETP